MFADKRIAIVTGAAGGMGRSIALQLAQQQCAIVAIDIDAQGLETLGSQVAPREAAPPFMALGHAADFVFALCAVV